MIGWCGPATDDNQLYKVGHDETKYAGIGPWGCDATESTVSYPIGGGTLSNFQCRWADSPGNNKSYTCTLRVDGTDTAASCSISGLSQTQCTVPGTFVIAAGNASVKVTGNGNRTNFGFRGILTP
jgi:hypothetical protein